MTSSRAYHQLWRVTDGAVKDCFNQHPDYLTNKGRDSARRSVVKRVTGAVIGFSVQAAKSRSGEIPAAEIVAVAAFDDGHIQGGPPPKEQGEVLQGASPDAWRIPGYRVQRAIEKTMVQYSERNTKGQFRHLKTPREIMLEALRQEYAPKPHEPILTAEEISALQMPPQVEPNPLGSAGCGGAETIDAQSEKYAGSEPGQYVITRFSARAGYQALGRSDNPAPEVMSGPHPSTFTPPPSAAHAARAGRAACLIVLLVAVATACIFSDTVAAAVSAGPIPLLWHGLVGRFA